MSNKVQPLLPRPSYSAKPHLPPQYRRYGEEAMFAEEHALMIFTELSNAGQPFGKILAALFLTGMHYAIELTKEQKE